MRKRILAVLLAAVTLVGCKSTTPTAVEPQTEPEPVQEEATDPAEEPEKTVNEDWDAYWAVVGPRSREDIELDEESAKLYDGFLGNEVSVVYDATADEGSYIRLSELLQKGQSYTLDEINQAMAGTPEYGEELHYEFIDAGFVDCGLDDRYEMVVQVGAAEFTAIMLIRNVDGNLKLCFSSDGWSRSYTEIRYSGLVYSGGSNGATSHSTDGGYIDAEGTYHFLDSWAEELIGANGGGVVNIDELGFSEDWLVFEERLSFDTDYDYSNDVFSFYIQDENSNEVKDDPSDPENPYEKLRALYRSFDYQAYTRAEVDQMEAEHRASIGLSDEVYHYGDELKPE